MSIRIVQEFSAYDTTEDFKKWKKPMKKNTLFTGTLILTLAGLLTRIMGFFYKIYLSNAMTTENLGLYQLIFPVYGICFTLYGSGIQTAISQLVANCPTPERSFFIENNSAKNSSGKNSFPTASHRQKTILRCGIMLSVSIALCLSLLVFTGSHLIASRFLMEPRCAKALQILSIVFPFCGITACINGYYYGLKQTRVPASTQLLEQAVRIGSVCLLAFFLGGRDKMVSCELAAFGIVLGEIASDLYSVSSLLMEAYLAKKAVSHAKTAAHTHFKKYKVPSPLTKLVTLAVPLTANRLVISLLHSFEAVLVPFTLQKFGLSTADSLSLYGILSGMAMPFILFPSAITNSLAVLLLPIVSEAQAVGNTKKIQTIGQLSIKCSLVIGIFAAYVFIVFGNALGKAFFHNEAAGYFMQILAWLCPFMYLSTTLSSMINGLGKTHLTFFNTILSLGLRIGLICLLVPEKGINGYLSSLLISQLILTLADYLVLTKTVSLPVDAINSIGKPVFILLIFGSFFTKFYNTLAALQINMPLLPLLGICLLLCICYAGMLFLTKAVKPEELSIR